MKSLFNITIVLLAAAALAACGPSDEDPLIGLDGAAENIAVENSTEDAGSINSSALRTAGSGDVQGRLGVLSSGDRPENGESVADTEEDATTAATPSATDSNPGREDDTPTTATTGTGSDPSQPTALVVKPAEQSSESPATQRQITSTTGRPVSAARQSTTSATSRSTTTARQSTTSATSRSTTSARQPTAGGAAGGRFETLPPGASLPSGAECAGRVRPAAEVRSMNAGYNSTRGTRPNGFYGRVDGNFVGTTDEIIQWAACKWGIDEDWARAQVAKESWWDMRSAGDRTSDQNACHPDLRTGSGTCPESIGLMQVRYLYHREAFVDANAIRSSAYNVDYGFAVWRACYNGELTWLNDVDRGATYGAGDLEGCLGVWFTGRWYVNGAQPYIDEVRRLKNSRIWEHSDFLGYKG